MSKNERRGGLPVGPFTAAAIERLHAEFTVGKQNGRWTQTSVAERAGFDQGRISKLFSGELKEPTFETVARLALAMGLSLDRLIDGVPLERAETPIPPSSLRKSSAPGR